MHMWGAGFMVYYGPTADGDGGNAPTKKAMPRQRKQRRLASKQKLK